jgi:hypothetical protein
LLRFESRVILAEGISLHVYAVRQHREIAGEYMKDLNRSKRQDLRGLAVIATAIGAVAIGAFAIGALSIRRLAIRRVFIECGEFKTLAIQDLTVTRLRAAEVTVSDSLKLPETNTSGN